MTVDANTDLFRDLDYEGFRRLASKTGLSIYNRIGFPDEYRERYEEAIFADVLRKIPLLNEPGKVILDIGPGCSKLPEFLIDHCRRLEHKLIFADSAEMLDLLPQEKFIRKIEGPFPDTVKSVGEVAGDGVDVVICYSVLQYIFVDFDLRVFAEALMSLLRPGGQVLLGDIPNVSKRRRFFSSEQGRAAHRAFTGRDELPTDLAIESEDGKLNDAVLLEFIARFRKMGADAYVVPQASDLPMANRREDILVYKP